MKKCRKCEIEKPFSEFYRHAQMADGYLQDCKECHKAAVKANRAANAERYKAFDRARSDLPHRVASRKRVAANRRTDPAKHAIDLERSIAHSRSDPLKKSARTVVGNAIRDGLLIPEPCAVCGTLDQIHGHHEDYSKPLDVIWLCPTHHGARHREINAERRKEAA